VAGKEDWNNGMMEYWNVGEFKSPPPIIPVFQYSSIPTRAEISNAVTVIPISPARHRFWIKPLQHVTSTG
jgi:hypothetical protein